MTSSDPPSTAATPAPATDNDDADEDEQHRHRHRQRVICFGRDRRPLLVLKRMTTF